MPELGKPLTRSEYVDLLRQSADSRNLDAGRRLHAHIAAAGHEPDDFIGNLLVYMYGCCGSPEDALAAFNRIRCRNVYSWCMLVTALAQSGESTPAGTWFEKMPQWNVVAWNSMITIYARSSDLQQARSVFDAMPERNVASWNTIITAYAQDGAGGDEAMQLFCLMDMEGTPPEKVTFLCLVEAVKSLRAGRLVHASSIDRDLDSDVIVSTTLVNMYGKCGDVGSARRLFESMDERIAMTWNALLTGYAQNGHLQEARMVLYRMPQRDTISWNVVVRAHARLGQVAEARELFEQMPEPNAVSWTIMAGAYSGASQLLHAKRMFEQVKAQNVVSWTAMIACYTQNGEHREALRAFKLMDLDGVHPNHVTFTAVLDACAGLAALPDGKLIHSLIEDSELEKNAGILASLITMYGNCGQLNQARQIFDVLPTTSKTLVLWTAMVAAYARCGHAKEATELYREMCLEGEAPDSVMLTCVLSACSHAGLGSNQAAFFLRSMADCGLEPTRAHLNCVVDLLSRAGELGQAEELLGSMPFVPDFVARTSFLSSCRVQDDVARASETAFECVAAEPDESSSYALLTGI